MRFKTQLKNKTFLLTYYKKFEIYKKKVYVNIKNVFKIIIEIYLKYNKNLIKRQKIFYKSTLYMKTKCKLPTRKKNKEQQ